MDKNYTLNTENVKPDVATNNGSRKTLVDKLKKYSEIAKNAIGVVYYSLRTFFMFVE